MLGKNYYLIFIYGLIKSLINMNATGMVLKETEDVELYKIGKLEYKWMYVPYLYGIISIIIFFIINNYFPKYLRSYWIAGLMVGFMYATLGITNDYNQKMYKIPKLRVYLIDLTFYSIFYGIVLRLVEKYICY